MSPMSDFRKTVAWNIYQIDVQTMFGVFKKEYKNDLTIAINFSFASCFHEQSTSVIIVITTFFQIWE